MPETAQATVVTIGGPQTSAATTTREKSAAQTTTVSIGGPQTITANPSRSG